jgi:uncharacterized protein (TIGR03118 family)
VRSFTRGTRVGAAVVFACLAFASTALAASDRYAVHNMVANRAGIPAGNPADRVDANIVNPWGLTSNTGSPWWPANEGSNTSTIVPANGTVNNTVVQVAGKPTGIVAGGIANNFLITGGTANFIFSTKSGAISGWRAGAASEVKVPASTAYYTGLALATTASGPMLYAPDFRNRKVDVYNGQWVQQTLAAGAFTDPGIPADYAPYAIQTIGSRIFVTYAQQVPGFPEEEFPGAGKGYVNAFDTAGTLLGRVASTGVLNAPWGTAQAPADFGTLGGDLLIGNFGDGRINAYKEGPANTWTFDGTMKGADGNPLFIGGLWAIQFGKDAAGNGSHTAAYFTAGPGGERDGVFGRIQNALPLDVSATVPAQLSLTLGPAVSFGSFAPGVGMDYNASTSATVISTAGNAALSVADPSSTATGHLVNGTFSLPQAVKAGATTTGAGGTGSALADVGGSASPTTLVTYTAPISNDNVTLNFRQTIGANDALRTGSYSKTLTFTLSTTAP